jgi:hypothetical protein
MNRFRTLIAAACGFSIMTSAYAAFTPPEQQSVSMVYMVRPAIGCSSHKQLERLQLVLAVQGQRAAVSAMQSFDCQPFSDYQGAVVDEVGNYICVIGIDGARCLWFGKEAFAPKRY